VSKSTIPVGWEEHEIFGAAGPKNNKIRLFMKDGGLIDVETKYLKIDPKKKNRIILKTGKYKEIQGLLP
jgi:hypothetical protein